MGNKIHKLPTFINLRSAYQVEHPGEVPPFLKSWETTIHLFDTRKGIKTRWIREQGISFKTLEHYIRLHSIQFNSQLQRS